MPIATGRAFLDPYLALKKAGLKSDMYFADLGAGMLGHFVFAASDIVGPEGRVYAVDILKVALESIESRARLESITNVLPIWGDMERKEGIDIRTGSVDVISLVGVANVVMKTTGVFEEARRLLKPGGQLLIVDWKPEAGSIIVKSHDRIAPALVQQAAQRSRFKLVESFDAGKQHWGIVLKVEA